MVCIHTLNLDWKLTESWLNFIVQSIFSQLSVQSELKIDWIMNSNSNFFFNAVKPLKVSPSFFRNAVVLFIIRHGHPSMNGQAYTQYILSKSWKIFKLVSQCMSNQRRQKQKYLLMLLEYVLMLPCAHDQLPSEKPTCARVLRICNRSSIPLLTLKNVIGLVGAPHWRVYGISFPWTYVDRGISPKDLSPELTDPYL